MKLSELFDLMSKWPQDVSAEERRIQFICTLLLFLPFVYVVTFIFCNLMHLNYFPFFLAICSSIVSTYFYIFYLGDLDKKYGVLTVKPANIAHQPYKYTYQGIVILLLLMSPIPFFIGLALGFTTNNFWFGLGGSIAMIYPIIGMFLRIKTFNDSSIPKQGDFGFMPISYWILATALGLYTVGLGFSDIHLYFANGSPSLEAAVFIIILGLLVQSVYLFPDKLNRVVPIDLRTKNGFWFMFVLVFVLFGVSQWLIGIVTALT